jgi:hypothetical protein
MTVSTAGVLAASATPTLTTLTTTGVTTSGGLHTASAGVTAAANQHVTVSGTGKFKHGDKTMSWLPHFFYETNSGDWVIGGSNLEYIISTAGNSARVPLHGLSAGDRIKSVTVAVYGDGAADLDWSLSRRDSANGGSTFGPGAVTVTNPAAAWADSASDVTDYTLLAGDTIQLLLAPSAAGIRIGPITVTYDRP